MSGQCRLSGCRRKPGIRTPLRRRIGDRRHQPALVVAKGAYDGVARPESGDLRHRLAPYLGWRHQTGRRQRRSGRCGTRPRPPPHITALTAMPVPAELAIDRVRDSASCRRNSSPPVRSDWRRTRRSRLHPHVDPDWPSWPSTRPPSPP